MRKFASIAFAGVSLLAIAQPAMAQDEPATAQSGQSAETDPGIVVSARRREESLQDVPQTVNAVTAETIDKLNLRNFTDITAVVPGLTMSGSGTFSTSATVRGVAFNPEASGNNPTVEFYLNDSPIASNFLFQSMFDVGQFELLRGPQGTLRGRASPSGSITLTTRKPNLQEVGVVANGTVTDTRSYKGDLAINVPIIRDVLGVRVAGILDQNEGNRVHTIKQATMPQYNEDPYRKTYGLRASARLEPIDWASFNVMYQTMKTETLQYGAVESASLAFGTPQPAGVPLIGPFDRLAIADVGPRGGQQLDILDWSAEFHFAGQRLTYVGSRTVQDFIALGGNDAGDYYNASRFAVVDRPLTDPAGFHASCDEVQRRSFVRTNNLDYYQCTHGVARRTSHEIRLQSEERIAGIFDYVVGAFSDKNHTPSFLTQETPVLRPAGGGNFALLTVSRTPIERDGKTKETSFFGNLTAHIGDRFELSGGLRHIKYTNFNSIKISGARPTPDSTETSSTWVYTASAKFDVSDDLMIYANTGSSWRPGPRVIGDFSLQQSALERSFLNLPAEKSKSYEAGIKAQFLDKRGHVNLSVYYQDFENYVYRGPGVAYVNYSSVSGVITPQVSTFNFVSAVPAEVKGFEIDAGFRITPHWSISANASYADGKVKNGVIACNDFNGDGVPDVNVATPTLAQLQAVVGANNLSSCNFSGPALNSAKSGANMTTEYSLDLSDSLGGFVRGLGTYTPSYKQDRNNAFDDVKSYALINLYAGLRDPDGAWELSLFAKNIFNTQRILGRGSSPSATGRTIINPLTGARSSDSFIGDYVGISTTAPRELGLNLRVAIGSR